VWSPYSDGLPRRVEIHILRNVSTSTTFSYSKLFKSSMGFRRQFIWYIVQTSTHDVIFMHSTVSHVKHAAGETGAFHDAFILCKSWTILVGYWFQVARFCCCSWRCTCDLWLPAFSYRPWRPSGLREVKTLTFSDIRLIHGGEVVSPTRWPPFTTSKIPGTVKRLSRPQGP
jgi:hypothetical protein